MKPVYRIESHDRLTPWDRPGAAAASPHEPVRGVNPRAMFYPRDWSAVVLQLTTRLRPQHLQPFGQESLHRQLRDSVFAALPANPPPQLARTLSNAPIPPDILVAIHRDQIYIVLLRLPNEELVWLQVSERPVTPVLQSPTRTYRLATHALLPPVSSPQEPTLQLGPVPSAHRRALRRDVSHAYLQALSLSTLRRTGYYSVPMRDKHGWQPLTTLGSSEVATMIQAWAMQLLGVEDCLRHGMAVYCNEAGLLHFGVASACSNQGTERPCTEPDLIVLLVEHNGQLNAPLHFETSRS